MEDIGGKDHVIKEYLKAAKATCDFYIENTAKDGIPYWDTGAPGLSKLGDWRNQKSNPYNDYEPVDSSAAAIGGAQGLLRLGYYLRDKDSEESKKYIAAGLTVASTLLENPYLSKNPSHQGLLLHTIYHRPNGWDYIPPKGSNIPNGEACMWGDYHLRELALYLQVLEKGGEDYYTFFNRIK